MRLHERHLQDEIIAFRSSMEDELSEKNLLIVNVLYFR